VKRRTEADCDRLAEMVREEQRPRQPSENAPDSLRAPGRRVKAKVKGMTRVATTEATGQASDKKCQYVMGIDPGPTESAYAIIRPDYTIVRAAKVPNRDLQVEDRYSDSRDGLVHVAIEGLACYGRPVGRETFETAYMVGRVCERAEAAGIPWTIYARPVYANAIAGCGKVTDAVLYQALRLRFGSNSKGGPLYALRGHSDLRSAFAIAAYWLDCSGRR